MGSSVLHCLSPWRARHTYRSRQDPIWLPVCRSPAPPYAAADGADPAEGPRPRRRGGDDIWPRRIGLLGEVPLRMGERPVLDGGARGRVRRAASAAPASPAAEARRVGSELTLRAQRLSVPKLSVPKLSVPKLSVPKLCVPKLCVPKLCVPKLCVPRDHWPEGAGARQGSAPHTLTTWPVSWKWFSWPSAARSVLGIVSCGSGPLVGAMSPGGGAGTPGSQT